MYTHQIIQHRHFNHKKINFKPSKRSFLHIKRKTNVYLTHNEMEKYNYICEYCSKEYMPRRRKIQKYCSNTCRVKAHFQKKERIKSKHETGVSNTVTSDKKQKEKINLAGIGNAAIANVATDTLKKLFTHEDSRPATKGDLNKLIAQFKNRYEKIENMPRRLDQTEAYFDNERKEVVYLRVTQQWR
jgi:hypothetical protein